MYLVLIRSVRHFISLDLEKESYVEDLLVLFTVNIDFCFYNINDGMF